MVKHPIVPELLWRHRRNRAVASASASTATVATEIGWKSLAHVYCMCLGMGLSKAGWWFGTWLLFFHSVGNNHPNQYFFRGVGIPPTRKDRVPRGKKTIIISWLKSVWRPYSQTSIYIYNHIIYVYMIACRCYIICISPIWYEILWKTWRGPLLNQG